jgi:hypothetical protein
MVIGRCLTGGTTPDHIGYPHSRKSRAHGLAGDVEGVELAVGSGLELGELSGDGAGVVLPAGAGVAAWLAATGVGLAAGGFIGPAAWG